MARSCARGAAQTSGDRRDKNKHNCDISRHGSVPSAVDRFVDVGRPSSQQRPPHRPSDAPLLRRHQQQRHQQQHPQHNTAHLTPIAISTTPSHRYRRKSDGGHDGSATDSADSAGTTSARRQRPAVCDDGLSLCRARAFGPVFQLAGLRRLLVLLVLLLADRSAVHGVRIYDELHIGGIFPIGGKGGWQGGQACMPAARMALEDVNNENNLLPGFKLTLHSNDSEVSGQWVYVNRIKSL